MRNSFTYDYYPFGMLVPQRNFSSPEYRYGFQGQEKDDEIKGNGNSVNYKFRMHDPRVGRFFAIDPLNQKYPHYTPYSFSGNKVIAYRELEGLEEIFSVKNGKKYRAFWVRKDDNLTVISKITNVPLDKIIKINEKQLNGKPDLIFPFQHIILEDLGEKVSKDNSNISSKNNTYNYDNAIIRGGEFFKELTTTTELGPSVQSQAKTVFYAAVAQFAISNLTLSQVLSKQSFGVSAAKSAISGVSQYLFNEGEVNVFGAITDGVSPLAFSTLVGNAFETNYNFKTGKISGRTVLFGEKKLSEFTTDAAINGLFGLGGKGTSSIFKNKTISTGSYNVVNDYIESFIKSKPIITDFLIDATSTFNMNGTKAIIKDEKDKDDKEK